MLFASLVIAEESALENVFEKFRSDGARGFALVVDAFGGKFERVVGGASIAVGKRSDAKEDVVGGFDGFVAQAVFFVGEGAAKQVDDLGSRERFEDVNL